MNLVTYDIILLGLCLNNAPTCLEIGEMTACQRAVEAAQEAAYMNGRYVVPQESTHYIPSCDYSGTST